MINIFLKILKTFSKSKFNFFEPPKTDIVIFDNESSNPIKEILTDKKYLILQTRQENIDALFVTLKIFFLSLYYYRGNFLSSYIISLIKIIKPKIVITYIDNSYKFSEVALRFKKINNNIKFIAIQNGARYEILENDYLYKKKVRKENYNEKFFIPVLLSLGHYEREIYKKFNVNVLKNIPVGSLAVEKYRKFKKKNKIVVKKKKQICLLSDHGTWQSEMSYTTNNLEKNFVLLTEFCLKFSKEYNYKLVICQKRMSPGYRANPNEKTDYEYEQIAYKKFLNKEHYKKYKKLLLKRKKTGFYTYKIMEESEVLISTMSLMLRENLLLRNKILAANLTGNLIYNFPINSFFSLNENNYDIFEKKLLNIIKMSNKKYFGKIGRKVDYCIKDNKYPSKIINTYIEKYLR